VLCIESIYIQYERSHIFEVIQQTVRTYERAKTVRKFTKGIELSFEQNSA